MKIGAFCVLMILLSIQNRVIMSLFSKEANKIADKLGIAIINGFYLLG